MPVEIVRYTKEQLLHLKDSPLVHKPDGLPSIEQWMEYVAPLVRGGTDLTRLQSSARAANHPAQRSHTGRPRRRPVGQPRKWRPASLAVPREALDPTL